MESEESESVKSRVVLVSGIKRSESLEPEPLESEESESVESRGV